MKKRRDRSRIGYFIMVLGKSFFEKSVERAVLCGARTELLSAGDGMRVTQRQLCKLKSGLRSVRSGLGSEQRRLRSTSRGLHDTQRRLLGVKSDCRGV